MNRYIITSEDENDKFSTGVLLSIEEAINPEDAMNQMAKKVIDDDFLELADKEDVSTESRVNLALWIINGLSGNHSEVKIYRVATNEVGDQEVLTPDDLGFVNHQSPTQQ